MSKKDRNRKLGGKKPSVDLTQDVIDLSKFKQEGENSRVWTEEQEGDAMAAMIAQQAEPGLAISAFCVEKTVVGTEYLSSGRVTLYFEDGSAFVMYGPGLRVQFARWKQEEPDPDVVEGSAEELPVCQRCGSTVSEDQGEIDYSGCPHCREEE